MTEHSERNELRLLVIEDESLIAMELEDMLEDLGHLVLGVGGSVSLALGLLDRFGPELDAVLLDANLGGKSAAPVADALRERGVPFVVASGYELDEVRQLGSDAPRLAKPYGKEEVRKALSSLA